MITQYDTRYMNMVSKANIHFNSVSNSICVRVCVALYMLA